MVDPGVSAATGALGSLLGKLTTLLTDEYKLLAGVRKQIQFLERELSTMRALLQKMADMEEKLDIMAKEWRGKVRDLSYDLEDCIDRFMDRLGSGDPKPKFMKRTAQRLQTVWSRHGIATEIKELKARVVEESERRDRYKLHEMSYYAPTRTVEIDPRMAALYEEVRGLVAMDGPMKHVTALLMDEKEMELKVVAIVGSGGLGKTTLAMEVYRKIGGDFRCRASVSVSRTLDFEKLLRDILSQIDEDSYGKSKLEGWEKEQLIRKIKLILTGKRYFIVIDDVWKEQDWTLIKAAFPDNNNGSRILATTRINGVAFLCSSNYGGQYYQMPPLDDVDSRRLFLKRIFPSDVPCPAELAEVSARILQKCGGLPLAIITFASLLASRTHNKDEWERLQDSIGTGSLTENDGNLKGMNDILLLSYWDLPHHLRTCLLYLCIYPEDYKINCEELKLKWMAEGFLATQWGRLDKVAQNCFNDLVNRNMIQTVIEYDGSVKYCRVHDMVLDLMVALSDEENFATVLNRRICNSFPSKIRRLSLHISGNEHTGAVSAIAKNKLHIRSLNMFTPAKQITYLMDLSALRVLHLDYCLEVRNIGSLRQLRYLRVHSYIITELPEEISKLQHLETLDLRECYKLLRLPSTVVQLQKLVHLLVSPRTRLPDVEFGSMQALEDLKKLNIWNTDHPMRFAEDLKHLTKLRKLAIEVSGEPLKDHTTGERLVKFLVSSISELGKRKLQSLWIDEGDVCEPMFGDPCCTYPYLQDLTIDGWTQMVPKGLTSLINLVNLSILVVEFDNEGLQLLMGMPSLSHLQLRIGMSNVEKMTIGSNGFKLIKALYLQLPDFRADQAGGLHFSFAAGSMPALRWLHLEFFPMMAASDFCADFGVQHLRGLAQLHVKINCCQAIRGHIEVLESSIEKAIDLHPNCEIHVSRYLEDYMYKDDKEWEEAMVKKEKGATSSSIRLERRQNNGILRAKAAFSYL